MNLRGENLNILENADNYSSILKTIQSNIHLSAESLKSARVSKLNNMAAWELEEIEHERNYEKNNKQLSWYKLQFIHSIIISTVSNGCDFISNWC